MEEREIRRGDIYYADLSPVVGSEQGGVRPVLVIQNNTGNAYSPTVIVAAVTSQPKTKLPTHVILRDRKGLEKNSVVLLEQVRTIDKSRLREYVGILDKQQMLKVDKALRTSTGVRKLDKPIQLCLCPVCAKVFYESRNILSKEQIMDKGRKKCVCFVRAGKGMII